MCFSTKVKLAIQNAKENFPLALIWGNVFYVTWRRIITIILLQDSVVNCGEIKISFVENWLWWLVSFHCRETEFGIILDTSMGRFLRTVWESFKWGEKSTVNEGGISSWTGKPGETNWASAFVFLLLGCKHVSSVFTLLPLELESFSSRCLLHHAKLCPQAWVK